MSRFLLINGPNLNLLGTREPDIYGATTLDTLEEELAAAGAGLGHSLETTQSNSEADLVDAIQAARGHIDFILINPGALTHTSVALRDALLGVGIPFIEVHISNVHGREAFRQHSYFSDIALGTISGLGTKGYELALLAAHDYLAARADATQG